MVFGYITGFFGGFREIIAPHVGELEEKAARELARQVKQYGKPLFMHSSFAGEGIPALVSQLGELVRHTRSAEVLT